MDAPDPTRDTQPGKSSPLVPLIVGVLIGLAGPVLAYLATTDSAEQASKTARESARAALIQSDTAELRSVIDNALVHLTDLRSRATGKQIEWFRYFSQDPAQAEAQALAADLPLNVGERRRARREALEKEQRGLTRAFNKARADGDRLWIRLGQRAAHNSYWTAYHEYGEVGACTAWDAPRSRDRQWHLDVLLDQAKAWGEQFRNLAYERVRSAPAPVALDRAAERAPLPATTSPHLLRSPDFITCSDLKGISATARKGASAPESAVTSCERKLPASREFDCAVESAGGDLTDRVVVVKNDHGDILLKKR